MAKRFIVSAVLKAKDEASGTIGRVEGRISKFSKLLEGGFAGALGKAAGALAAFVAIMRSAIGAAQTQEDAVASLQAALERLGPGADEAAAALADYAGQLQKTTRFGDEAIIQAQALLATLGVQASDIPKATAAAVDLAAAFKIDLQAAARNLGRTFGGTAGELAELVPALRDLDEAALRSGAAIEVVAKQLGGRAAADAKTFSGQVAQLSNAIGDLHEVLGESVTKNGQALAAISKLRDAVSSPRLVAGIEAVTTGLSVLVNVSLLAGRAVVAMATFIPGLIAEFGRWAASFDTVNAVLDKLRIGLGTAAEAIRSLLSTMGLLGAASAETGKRIKISADRMAELEKAARRAGIEVDRLVEAEKRAIRIAGEQATAQQLLLQVLDSVGVKFTDFSAELAKTEAALLAIDTAYREGRVSAQEYETVVAQIQAKQAELRGELDAGTDATGRLGQSFRMATADLSALDGGLDRTRLKIDQVTQSSDTATRSMSRLGQASAAAAIATRSGESVDFGSSGFTVRRENGNVRTIVGGAFAQGRLPTRAGVL